MNHGDAADVSVTNIDNDGSIMVTIASISPTSIPAGTSNLPFNVSGSGFQPGASVTFESGSGPAPQLTSATVSNVQIGGTISVSKGGPRGSRFWDVRVTNPDLSTAVLPGALTVVK